MPAYASPQMGSPAMSEEAEDQAHSIIVSQSSLNPYPPFDSSPPAPFLPVGG